MSVLSLPDVGRHALVCCFGVPASSEAVRPCVSPFVGRQPSPLHELLVPVVVLLVGAFPCCSSHLWGVAVKGDGFANGVGDEESISELGLQLGSSHLSVAAWCLSSNQRKHQIVGAC